ncbi:MULTISPECIES: isocitrate/isopropylmalate dehydrogenase family protein [Methanoculleus]|jgi:tartrate dehydrogenase/decarboxylase/D-malate dehydrogenase|uniref:3-isopropylmalate dehydrogenase n=1 Tax=Methanoculleus thermophilus TaxID=2200 RepID=A0A1G8XCL6_9EURY|nr:MULTISPECIES: isocitrate/isopropylmalate dehydrogenase family protein [Methanoculleus]NLN09461.1 isocitrate/isopropylmalate dehydrogenase family protein [Methanoculleus thermophilus]SDJ88114.1 3-isopropylmalate dehydrogenase [Methanoculleus thermophilus]HQD25504.1 isocitrate/isopropylmalate dehydrogenase family protein [Methanoculleus thermophilus]
MQHKVALIGGDGIGPEIVAAGREVLDAAGERYGFDINWTEFDIGAERYLATGELLTEEDIQELSKFPAIYFGAIGDDRVRPGILEKGILLAIRFHFDQFINLRPIKLLDGVTTPLANKKPEDIDFVVVRENTEDFYVGIGSRFSGTHEQKTLEVVRDMYNIKFGLDVETDADELAYQIGVITRPGAERVIRYAFDLANRRRKKVTSVDKANVLSDVYGLWRDVFTGVAAGYPDIQTEFNFVDAVTMWFVKNPEWFDVVVTPNMFGDIITDLGAMIQGGLGLAPGGNINPDGTSMFEPIHGSAPKYRGQDVANPLATIWAGSMLLDHLGEHDAAAAVLRAIERSIRDGYVTRDMGGAMKTSEVGRKIAELVKTV